MRAILAIFVALLLVSCAGAQTFKVFYTFSGSDGSFPNGDLLRDSAGNFYGTTQFGGLHGQGTVFELDPTGVHTILYSFTGGTDGGIPIGRVGRDQAGNLYGITSGGGDVTCACGTVFKLQPNGTLTVLHSFKGGTDGAQNEGQPELGLVSVGSDFYGAASFGGVTGCDGALGCGVLFKVNQSSQESVLYRFTGQADGAFPQDLIRDQAGNLYGGASSYVNSGIVFKLDTAGNLTTLYTFPGGALGVSPRWRLIRTSDGTFYGVTQYGGNTSTCAASSIGCGVVYTLDANQNERVLHAFGQQSSDGETPAGGLLKVAGNLYGTTFYGGTTNSTCTSGCGVVYQVNTSGRYKVLYRFTGAADGWLPTGGLTQDSAGNLYGSALLGGGSGSGVIFEITP